MEAFNITPQEKAALLDTSLPDSSMAKTYFDDKIYVWHELLLYCLPHQTLSQIKVELFHI